MLPAYLILSVTLGLTTASTANPVQQTQNALSDAACTFTIQLLKTGMEGGEDNLVASPVSIGAVLAMLQQGAKDTTAEQLQKVLHLSPDKSKQAFSTLAAFFKNEERNVTLEWANGIYVRNDFVLDENYRKTIEENFRSRIESRNFTDPSGEETLKTINKWISEVTHQQIKDLVEASMITVDTVMIVINAIYFKGVWASKFQHARTHIGDFHLSKEKSTQVVYMRQEDNFPAGEDSTLDIKWVELPYQDNQFSMLLVLPNENDGLDKLVDTMTGEHLQKLISNTETRHVKLEIPKFKLKWKRSVINIMEKMGLCDIFTSKANLEGISSSKEGLAVSELVHEANIEIDEDGTVASGATVAFVQVLSLFVNENEMIFYADHPFLAFIVDKNNKIPLFAAKVGDPSSGYKVELPPTVIPTV